jgi:hypothetical protein
MFYVSSTLDRVCEMSGFGEFLFAPVCWPGQRPSLYCHPAFMWVERAIQRQGAKEPSSHPRFFRLRLCFKLAPASQTGPFPSGTFASQLRLFDW